MGCTEIKRRRRVSFHLWAHRQNGPDLDLACAKKEAPEIPEPLFIFVDFSTFAGSIACGQHHTETTAWPKAGDEIPFEGIIAVRIADNLRY